MAPERPERPDDIDVPAGPARTGRGRRTGQIVLGAATVGFVAASVGIANSAQADNYPSWGEVQKARQDVADQKKLVSQITSIVLALQSKVDDSGMQAEIAVEKYHEAKAASDAATKKYEGLKSEASSAGERAQVSQMRAGLLASHLARTAGGDPSLSLLLQGENAADADALLYQLGTMSQLTVQSQQIYTQALADRNTASSLAEQAKAAESEMKKAADAAHAALESANAAAADARSALSVQQQKQGELVAQLATLQSTSVSTAQQYLAGKQAEAAAKKAAAEKAAQEKAAQEAAAKAAAEQQAKDAGKGGKGSGASTPSSAPGGAGPSSAPGTGAGAPSPGSSPSSTPSGGSTDGGSGSGGSGGLNGGGSPVGAPNPTVVANAIAYARAQLGKPYIIDGAGPKGFDCSGLTMMAYSYAGLDIGGHGVNMQYYAAAAKNEILPYAQAQAGDLLFWGAGPGSLYHVGIYLGGGMMLAAPDVGDVVKIQPVWGSPYPFVARPAAG